jgi:hypothetical protein
VKNQEKSRPRTPRRGWAAFRGMLRKFFRK